MAFETAFRVSITPCCARALVGYVWPMATISPLLSPLELVVALLVLEDLDLACHEEPSGRGSVSRWWRRIAPHKDPGLVRGSGVDGSTTRPAGRPDARYRSASDACDSGNVRSTAMRACRSRGAGSAWSSARACPVTRTSRRAARGPPPSAPPARGASGCCRPSGVPSPRRRRARSARRHRPAPGLAGSTRRSGCRVRRRSGPNARHRGCSPHGCSR